MRSEFELVLGLINNPETIVHDGVEMVVGRIGAYSVTLMQCGIGKVNAAVGTVAMIDSFNPGLIINTGIAGGTGGGAQIMDIVVAEAVAYHDVYCGPPNPRGVVQGMPGRFECRIPAELNLSALEGNPRIRRGLIASGDIFVSTPQELAAVLAVQPDAIACDMESAAIAQVCHRRSVPFLAIRVVSDTPGADDHLAQYENFFTVAPQSTFSLLKSLLM